MVAMPFVHQDQGRNRSYYHRRYPLDVSTLTGKFYTKKYPVGISYREACAISHEQTAEFMARVEAARKALADPQAMAEWEFPQPRYTMQQHRQRQTEFHDGIASIWQTIARMDGEIERSKEEAVLYRMAARLGVAIPVPEETKRVDPEIVLKLWEAQRGQSKRGAPKVQALLNKRSKLARLFAWQAGEMNLNRRMSVAEVDALLARGDMAAISPEDAEAYAKHLDGRAFDHLLDLRPLFALAKKKKLITVVDPFADIKLPYKPVNTRQAFEREEAARILIQCRDATPYLKWMNRIACFSGAIPSELHMLTNESVREHHGVWSLFIKPPKGERMKTEYRPRIIPLHPSIRDEFVDYARALPPGPLFPDAPRGALNKFIHDLGITRTYYSWRHMVTDQLESIVLKLPQGTIPVPPDLARYIMGHTMPDTHSAHYVHPDSKRRFPEVVAAIAGLEDPTQSV